MIRAIVWKEFREQGLIGLTLIVLGSGVLGAAASLGDAGSFQSPPSDVIRFLGPGLLATLLLTVTAGMVCGGALFAAEREAGTACFLEAFPVSRWDLWRAKLAAGSLLVLLQIGAVLTISALLGFLPTGGWAFAVAVYAMLAFVWGMFGSTLARTTLGSVGIAIAAASVASFVYLLPILIFFQHPGTNLPRQEGGLAFLLLMFLTPLTWSALAFTKPDRERANSDVTPDAMELLRSKSLTSAGYSPEFSVEPAVPSGPRLGLKALVWLSARQLRMPGAVLSGFALLFGLALLLPKIPAFHVLPVLALTAGVISGVMIFLDEQSHGSNRYWGERRLPLMRLWAVKLTIHAGLALWIMALIALPSCLRAAIQSGPISQGQTPLSAIFRTALFDQRNLAGQGWKYLLTPLIYGFAFGHLCGLLIRKAVVATGVAGLIGGTAAALWVPSLLAGGVWYWQIVAPAILILATAYVLRRPWANDRIATRRPVSFVVAGGAAALLMLAGGIGYRVVEVPDGVGGEDDIRYVAALIPFDTNESGRQFRTAAERFSQSAGMSAAETPRLADRQARVEDRAELATVQGYPRDDRALADWLDQVFLGGGPMRSMEETPWHVLAAWATDRPIGHFEHPHVSGTSSSRVAIENARRMGIALIARGLQKQSEGESAEFVDHLRVVLSLSRNMRNGSIIVSYLRGVEVARLAFTGTDQWLSGGDLSATDLRRALDVLLEDQRAQPTRILEDGRVVRAHIPPVHEDFPFDARPHLLAERYVLRELQKSPNQWLPGQLTASAENRDVVSTESDLVEFAWSVPWERERTRRLAGLGLEPGSRAEYRRLTRGRPGFALLSSRTPSPDELGERDRQLRLFRRVTIAKLAIRLYIAEKSEPPPGLSDLVSTGYLPEIPVDPYSGDPLRYRISEGEVLRTPFLEEARNRLPPGAPFPKVGPGPAIPLTVRAEPGQPIVWSVGTNKKDDGGTNLPQVPGVPLRGADFVFLVPLPTDRQ